jgi:hypothetical protein
LWADYKTKILPAPCPCRVILQFCLYSYAGVL